MLRPSVKPKLVDLTEQLRPFKFLTRPLLIGTKLLLDPVQLPFELEIPVHFEVEGKSQNVKSFL